jgi:tetratricopeptide (TPR) repeat protein
LRTLCTSTLIVAILGSAVVRAAEPDAGTAPNLSLGAGGRGIALGGAFIADVQDASAVYWNPAALVLDDRPGLAVMHAAIGFGTAGQSFVGVDFPTLRAGHFGLGVLRLSTAGIAAYDAASRPLGEIEFSETAAFVSYATAPRFIGGRLALGGTVKSLTQTLTPQNSTGIGLDLGMRAEILSRRLAVAGVLQNAVAPRLELQGGVEQLPARLLLGTTAHVGWAESHLGLHLGTSYQGDAGWHVQLGAEYRYRQRLALRVGRSEQGIAFGVGVHWDRFELDYAQVARQNSTTHPVSMNLEFGSSLPERLAAQERERQSQRDAEVASRLGAMVRDHLGRAQAAYDRGDYAAALEEWKLAANLETGNRAARLGMESARAKLAEQQANVLRNQNAAFARVAQFEVGLRYYSENDYALARNVWLKLLEQDPNDAVVRDYLVKTEEGLRAQVRGRADAARKFEAGKDWVSALTEWNAVQALDALHPEAVAGLERCRAKLEGAKVPPTLASRPTGRTPSREEAVRLRFETALAQYHSGDFAAARSTLAELLQMAPDHAEGRRLLARTERRLRPLTGEEREKVRSLYVQGLDDFTAGRYEKAIDRWSMILELDPGNESVARNIEEARARIRERGR